MESVLHLERSTYPRRVLGRRAGLLFGFAALIVVLFAVFAYVVVHFERESRHQAQGRFGEQATLTAQFTSSLLTTSAASSQASAAKTFGAATISPATLAALVKTPSLDYVVILDKTGQRIAASPGAPAVAAKRDSVQVQQAIAGHADFSSLISIPGRAMPVLEWAQPFTTRYGRRVEVEGLPANALSSLLAGFLAKSQTNSNSVSFILDTSGRVIAASSTAIKVGGYPKSTGLVAALASGASGGYRYKGVDRYFSSAAIAGTNWRAVSAVPTSNLYPPLVGSESWILYAVLVAFAAVGVLGIYFFRQALISASALRSTNATLEQRVAERTAAAEERATELARSNEELEQFSSVASHDLQEPLRKIRMFGDRLRDRLGDRLEADAAADLDRMQNAAERMQRLINDLLDFSRVTHRGSAFLPVDLGEVATEVVGDLEARIVELDGRVEVGELPVIEADRTQMRQLLQNLIGNALKFHRPDTAPVVRITSELLPPQSARFAGEAAAGARCVLVVADNGIGFDEKHAERIFGAFERLHGRSVYDGTGIGLSIARKIAWRHGGHIVATGVPDQGATFTVTLPLSHPTSANGGTAA